MSLAPGERLGPYEIRGSIGAGGMGEVYQARDTRLGRDLAIKVSAAEFSARFEREARAIAALNHPNICALYDVGPDYLVMEFVAGRTLAEIIAAARTPDTPGVRLSDAVAIARQIAEALEAAHEKGVVHRDLKPSNVKVTPDGVVKVLDFGLAKTLDQEQPDASTSSPTFTSPAATERGVILGTARYMAPEQAAGRPMDRRADIWAFGVVLFEMLTGRPLFRGETTTEIIAAVIKDDIALEQLPPDVPPAIRRLLARCLERDPRQRLRDIGEARIVLSDPSAIAPVTTARPPDSPGRSRASWLGWAALTLLLTSAAGAAGWWLEADPDLPLRRIELAGPLASADGWALNPDGSRVAYVSDARLYVRALDALVPQDLGAVHVTAGMPFWSPDGRSIGFYAGGALYTISAAGGPIRQVCRIPGTGRPLDFAWRADARIFLSVARNGVFVVPAEGGTPELYLPIDPETEIEFASVSPLPDNRLIVTTRVREPSSFRTEMVGAGPDRQRTTIIADPDVTFVKHAADGMLLFRRRGANTGIWAVPFDGVRVDIAQAAVIAPRGTFFQTDAAGTALIALPPPTPRGELVWMTERGSEITPVPGAPVEVGSPPVLSPDGRRVALVVDTEGDRHLLVRDLETGSDIRLTPAGAETPTLDTPSWFPSGDEVVFATGPVTSRRIVSRRTDGSGGLRTLADGLVGRVMPTGQHLVLLIDDGGVRRLRYAPLAAGAAAVPVFEDSDPVIVGFDLSPDGKAMAYAIPEADGRLNVFLTDFPAGNRQMQVTTTGAGGPQFSPDGNAIFYLAPAVPMTDSPRGALARLPVSLASLAASGPPAQLFVQGEGPASLMLPMFDIGRDGRLLMMRRAGGEVLPSARLVLVQNWRAALGR